MHKKKVGGNGIQTQQALEWQLGTIQTRSPIGTHTDTCNRVIILPPLKSASPRCNT